jgi:hypothetical protein
MPLLRTSFKRLLNVDVGDIVVSFTYVSLSEAQLSSKGLVIEHADISSGGGDTTWV